MTAAGDFLLNEDQRTGEENRKAHGKAAGEPMQRLEQHCRHGTAGFHEKALQQQAASGLEITQNIGPI
ncbi:hypothetical protein J2T09_003243 [Neorhizobium huautlense]|uniref:Uncharacterized protein n=1 Tax=Neorhizobium huautlense TaxID=67774 RepID=A0ABT9PW81_9HYPH|nr:hypothetical protein [Neorhizobium huautlense]MDP9838475.1 hypothetical protein [Neorhizobium huautlense]